MQRHMAALAVFFLCLPVVAAGAVIHVPSEQPTIQAGINAAVDGDTVLVADGTYTGEGNRDLDFGGKAIALLSENGPLVCVIDSQGNGPDHHRGLWFHSGEGRDSVVEGFDITGGHTVNGGAILCDGASPTIRGNVIEENRAIEAGGGFCCLNGAAPLIEANRFLDNFSWTYHIHNGGGVACIASSPEVTGNYFEKNSALNGGGLYSVDASPAIRDNIFFDNYGYYYGGAICCEGSGAPQIKSNKIIINYCSWYGGGIYCVGPAAQIYNNLIDWNFCDYNGGGIFCSDPVEIAFCTVQRNYAENYGGGVYGSGTIVQTIFGGNMWDNLHGDFDVTWTCNSGYPGQGNFSANPLWVTGPQGDYYLSQIAAGQAEDSPCVDAGNPASLLIEGTTRTDEVRDLGRPDIGYHYPLEAGSRLVIGPGPGYDNLPLVSVFPLWQDAIHDFEFSAYGPSRFGVIVTAGDVTGDGFDEILTGAGPGEIYGPHVRGFEKEGTPLPGLSFLAYGTNKYGVNVATGDLDADGNDEIITGAGPGAVFGPHVRGWDYDGSGGVIPIPGVSYFAYGTPKWGVNVSCGDIDGDGFDEIVTGAGPGAVYGPHVRGWNVDGGPALAIPGVSFLAYGTDKYGVNVTAGDVDGDGIDEIVTGAGPGPIFGPHVRGWNYDGASISSLPGFSFFAWQTEPLQFGVNIFAGADLDSDGRDELIAGRGPAAQADTEVKVFTYDGSTVSEWFSLEAFPGLSHGVNVAAGSFRTETFR